MEIIECPNCKGTISDKANSCVHCGYPFKAEKGNVCIKCGAELERDDDFCHNCGHLTELSSQSKTPQEKIIKESGKPTRPKKSFFIVAIVLVLIAVFAVQQQYAKSVSEAYASNISIVSYMILDSSVDVENCGNLITQVWHNVIWNKKSDETDIYTRVNGTGAFHSDFNDALDNLFRGEEYLDLTDKIYSDKQTITDIMGEMRNPPAEWQDAYDELKDLFDYYIEFANVVLYPTGSLTSFSEEFSELDRITVKYFNRMKMYIN